MISVRQQLRDERRLESGCLAEQEGGGGDGEGAAAGRGQTQPRRRAEAGRRDGVQQEDWLSHGHGDQADGEGDSE